jgi:hypothetical protein
MEESRKRDVLGIRLIGSLVLFADRSPLVKSLSKGAHGSPYIRRRAWGTKWMVLYPWDSVFNFLAPPQSSFVL